VKEPKRGTLFRDHLLAALFFLVVVAVATWPSTLRVANSLPDAGDPAENVWTLHWIASAATNNPAQLYAAPIFHGFPNALAYDDTSLGPGLLLAPLWLSSQYLLFYNLLMWASLALLGFTAYLLVRDLTGSTLAGLVGGLVCTINSYNLAHLSHLNVLSAYLLPVGLLALRRLFHPGETGPRWSATLVALLATVGQLLSSFYIFAYMMLALGGYLIWQGAVSRAVWRWPTKWLRRLAAQLAALGLAIAVAAWLVVAPYVAVQQVMGFARTEADTRVWSAQPIDYLSVSPHNRTYARLLPHNDSEPLFAGFGTLSLAGLGLLGVVMVRRRRVTPASPASPAAPLASASSAPDPARTRSDPSSGAAGGDLPFYALLLVVGILFTLGPTLEIGTLKIPLPYRLLAGLPGGAALRAPVRAMTLVNLSLGLFAGLGALRLRTLMANVWLAMRATSGGGALTARPIRHVAWTLFLASIMALVLGEQWIAPIGLVTMPAGSQEIPAAYRWLAGHPDGGVLVEMPASLGLSDPTVDSTHMYYQTWHGHPLVNGYSSFRPPTYEEIVAKLDGQHNSFQAEQLGILQSLGVRYVLFHAANYKERAWTKIEHDLRQLPQVHEIGAFPSGTFGDDHLYWIEPLPPGAGLRLYMGPSPTNPSALVVQVTNPYMYPLLSRLRPTLDLEGPDGQSLSIATPLALPGGISTFRVPYEGDQSTDWTPQQPVPRYLVMAHDGREH
jgi:hypothetical protein